MAKFLTFYMALFGILLTLRGEWELGLVFFGAVYLFKNEIQTTENRGGK